MSKPASKTRSKTRPNKVLSRMVSPEKKDLDIDPLKPESNKAKSTLIDDLHYRGLFEESPISLWEEDYSEIKIKLDKLRRDGVTDLRQYLYSHTDFVVECANSVKTLDVNKATLKLYEADKKEELLTSLEKIISPENIMVFADEILALASGEKTFFWEGYNKTLKGNTIYVEMHLSVLPGHEDTYSRVIASIIDRSSRKLAEDALRISEQFAQSTIDALSAHICVLDENGTILSVNRAWREFADTNPPVPENYCIGSNYLTVCGNIQGEQANEAANAANGIRAVIHGDIGNFQMEYSCHSPTENRWFVLRVTRFPGEGQQKIAVTHENISERRQMDEALQNSQERYRALFEASPVSIWEQDFSGAKSYIDSLKSHGISDLRSYFDLHPEAVIVGANLIRILDVNNTAVKMYKAAGKKELIDETDQSLGGESLRQITETLISIADAKTSFHMEGTDETVTGEIVEISLGWNVVPGHEEDYSRVIVTTVDITERKHAEQELKNTLYNLNERIKELNTLQRSAQVLQDWRKSAFEVFQEIVSLLPEGWQYPEITAARIRYDGAEFKTLNFSDSPWKQSAVFSTHDEKQGLIEIVYLEERPMASEGPFTLEERNLLDILANHLSVLLERKKAEEKLRESEERFASAFENAAVGMAMVSLGGRWLKVNRSLCDLLGYSQEELLNSSFQAVTHPDDLDTDLQHVEDLLTGSPKSYQMEKRYFHKNGNIIWVVLNVSIVRDKESKPLYFISQIKDISERKRAEAEISHQLTELKTLYESGLAINSLLRPKEIANKVIEVLARNMNWHHIAIRQYDAESNKVELIGFSQPGLSLEDAEEEIIKVNQLIQRPEQGLSGWVTRHGTSLRIADVKQDDRYTSVYSDIQSGMYAPLKVGERVIGSISVESENLDAFSTQDERLLVTLANQAAVAIENAKLYTRAQQEINDREQAEAKLQQQMDEQSLLLSAGRELSNALELDQIYSIINKHISQWIPCDTVVISSYTSGDQLIRCNYLHTREGLQDVSNLPAIPLEPEGRGTQSMVIRNGRSLLLPDYLGQLQNTMHLISNAGEVAENDGLEDDELSRSAILVPLIVKGQVTGVLQVFHHEKNIHTESHLRFVEALAYRVSSAITNANLFKELQLELMERRFVEEEMRHLNADLETHVQERTAEIETTRQRLQLATQAARLGIWEWNLQQDKMIWDAQMNEIYDVRPEDFDEKIKTFTEVIHPDDQQELVKIARAILRKEEHYQTEYRIITRHGVIKYIAAQGIALYDEKGEPVKIIGTVRDITPQKQAEYNLLESETYARLLFDASPDPFFVANIYGMIVDANRAFEEQLGLESRAVSGKFLSDLNIFPENELNKYEEYVSRIMKGEKSPPVELDFNAPDGTLHTLEMNSYPIEVKGNPLVLSTSRDITLHKSAEETLRLANVEMERALRIKDEFLASMSHELRTPLNSILGISESLEEQIAGPLNLKQQKYLHTISESGRHLLELINDILDLSKIEAGRMDLNVITIPAEHLIQSSLRIVKELAQKKGLKISVSMDPEVKTLKGDERRLKQALVNLLSNAVKFTPENGDIGIKLKGNKDASQVNITVWDHGIGISEANMRRLFKPFVQLDSSLSREYAGTGLGLALVAQMVRLHGGSVGVTSEPDKGSNFTIALPWEYQEQSVLEEKHAKKRPVSPQLSEKRSGKVLIFEDTEAIGLLLDDYLRHLGYESFVSQDAISGIEVAKREKPDIILMDVMMPGMDGMDATKILRSDPDFAHTPIIAITALAMHGDRERCLAAGMNDYMSKPIQLQDLSRMLDLHLKSSKGN